MLRRDSQDAILRAFGVPRAVAFDAADTTVWAASLDQLLTTLEEAGHEEAALRLWCAVTGRVVPA